MSETGMASDEREPTREELEAQLFSLLRTKYKVHWREKNNEAGGSPSQEKQAELKVLREEIKSVFDRIRLMDKKYKIPPLHMFE